MLNVETIKQFYLREDVQKAILANAEDREVAVKFGDHFGKRPDMLQYKADIADLAKQGATSFHTSEERWKNPLLLDPMMKRGDMEALRTGWDLIIDIDCGFFEYSKIAADLIIKLLAFHNLQAISCKFSGNKGFHIGVPFEAFPAKIKDEETRVLFPDAPKRIALYIKEMIKKRLGEKIMAHEKDFNAIIKKTGKKGSDITYYDGEIKRLNAEPFLEIDTLLISSRHLYRMPYSFNEKSGLVSVPIDPEKVMAFGKEHAKAENVTISPHIFLDRTKAKENEANTLLVQAFDFNVKHDEIKPKRREYEPPSSKIGEDFFPPCIQKITKGLEDGRKRALFILINFLKNVGWDHTDIETYIKEWNKKNKEPLRDNYVHGQLSYQKGRKPILPPNCHNNMYYTDMRVKCDETICRRFKNPVNYSIRRTRYLNGEK